MRRHIDCAAAYGNENVVGEGFANVFKEGKVTRKDVWITSKLNNPDHGRVREACEQTIKDLKAEYLDLYLMHWPLTGNKGKEVEPPIKVRNQQKSPVATCAFCLCSAVIATHAMIDLGRPYLRQAVLLHCSLPTLLWPRAACC